MTKIIPMIPAGNNLEKKKHEIKKVIIETKKNYVKNIFCKVSIDIACRCQSVAQLMGSFFLSNIGLPSLKGGGGIGTDH